MELEAIKNKISSLREEEKHKREEIDKLAIEKLQYEQKAQSLGDEISRLEQEASNKRDEIKKYSTTLEIMEL